MIKMHLNSLVLNVIFYLPAPASIATSAVCKKKKNWSLCLNCLGRQMLHQLFQTAGANVALG